MCRLVSLDPALPSDDGGPDAHELPQQGRHSEFSARSSMRCQGHFSGQHVHASFGEQDQDQDAEYERCNGPKLGQKNR